MAGELGSADVERMARGGVLPISAAQGLALFDAAALSGEPLLVPAQLDPAGLRAQAEAGQLPPLLRGLVRGVAARRTVEANGPSLAQRLAGVAGRTVRPCWWSWSAPRWPLSSVTPGRRPSRPTGRSATWASTR